MRCGRGTIHQQHSQSNWQCNYMHEWIQLPRLVSCLQSTDTLCVMPKGAGVGARERGNGRGEFLQQHSPVLECQMRPAPRRGLTGCGQNSNSRRHAVLTLTHAAVIFVQIDMKYTCA